MTSCTQFPHDASKAIEPALPRKTGPWSGLKRKRQIAVTFQMAMIGAATDTNSIQGDVRGSD